MTNDLASILRAVWEKLYLPTSQCPHVSLSDVLSALVGQLQERENPLYSPLERKILAYLRIAGPRTRMALHELCVQDIPAPTDDEDSDAYEAKVQQSYQDLVAALSRLDKAKVIRKEGLYHIVV